jgi:hypothetical protein
VHLLINRKVIECTAFAFVSSNFFCQKGNITWIYVYSVVCFSYNIVFVYQEVVFDGVFNADDVGGAA